MTLYDVNLVQKHTKHRQSLCRRMVEHTDKVKVVWSLQGVWLDCGSCTMHALVVTVQARKAGMQSNDEHKQRACLCRH